jgi:hypothetical protein
VEKSHKDMLQKIIIITKNYCKYVFFTKKKVLVIVPITLNNRKNQLIMKRLNLLFALLLFAGIVSAQVGIGTATPIATLDVVGDAAGLNTPIGFKIPVITGDQLGVKTNNSTFGIPHTGTQVYVTAKPTTPANIVALPNVTTAGVYVWLGTTWAPMSRDRAKRGAWFISGGLDIGAGAGAVSQLYSGGLTLTNIFSAADQNSFCFSFDTPMKDRNYIVSFNFSSLGSGSSEPNNDLKFFILYEKTIESFCIMIEETNASTQSLPEFQVVAKHLDDF